MKGGVSFWLIQGDLVHLHNVIVWVTLKCSWFSDVKAQNTDNCFVCRNAFRWLLWNLFSLHIPLWWDFQFLHCIFDVSQEISHTHNYKKAFSGVAWFLYFVDEFVGVYLTICGNWLLHSHSAFCTSLSNIWSCLPSKLLCCFGCVLIYHLVVGCCMGPSQAIEYES